MGGDFGCPDTIIKYKMSAILFGGFSTLNLITEIQILIFKMYPENMYIYFTAFTQKNRVYFRLWML